MTFSSSDAAEGCKRIAYVGNTHNYQDGADLTEALCKKLGYKGKVAILVGTAGAPCHEDRARGARDTIARYNNTPGIYTFLRRHGTVACPSQLSFPAKLYGYILRQLFPYAFFLFPSSAEFPLKKGVEKGTMIAIEL